MNIIPISSMAMLQDSPLVTKSAGTTGEGIPFQNMFAKALQNVEETQAQKDADSVALALGEVDDLAAVQINSQKATLAVQMVVELRNRVLEAYNEIMRVNV